MKVKTVIKFKDKNTGKMREVGDIFVCTKDRYDEIMAAGAYVEEVEAKKAEKDEPKKESAE